MPRLWDASWRSPSPPDATGREERRLVPLVVTKRVVFDFRPNSCGYLEIRRDLRDRGSACRRRPRCCLVSVGVEVMTVSTPELL